MYVDCVEGLTEVQGHNYGATWWLRFVKNLSDLVVSWCKAVEVEWCVLKPSS